MRTNQPKAAGPDTSEKTKDPCSVSLELGKKLAGFGPLYAADVPTQFCLQAARRKLGEVNSAREWYTRFGKYIDQGPWHDAAAAELWLDGQGTKTPRRVGRCSLTETRPHLDGNFDDACWQGQPPLRLTSAAGDSANEYRTDVMFAHDQEFLYLALRCQHPAGQQVAPVKPRTRDADVDRYDHVSLLLDVDRDYATYYRLQVDQRGCVREDCWGDVSWNPRWFVAVNRNDTVWQIEAAIPLAELTGERIPLGSAWAFNVVRTLPGRGVQSFSLPADVHPRPDGMCPLVFQQNPMRGDARPMPREP
jgi:hypothetical protein